MVERRSPGIAFRPEADADRADAADTADAPRLAIEIVGTTSRAW